MMIVTEAMFFAGLLSAYFFLRASDQWPPGHRGPRAEAHRRLHGAAAGQLCPSCWPSARPCGATWARRGSGSRWPGRWAQRSSSTRATSTRPGVRPAAQRLRLAVLRDHGPARAARHRRAGHAAPSSRPRPGRAASTATTTARSRCGGCTGTSSTRSGWRCSSRCSSRLGGDRCGCGDPMTADRQPPAWVSYRVGPTGRRTGSGCGTPRSAASRGG